MPSFWFLYPALLDELSVLFYDPHLSERGSDISKMKIPKPPRRPYLLHIPIGSKAARTRLENLFSHLLNDPLAAALPHAAWLSVRQWRYHIEQFTFDENQLIKAIELLRSSEVTSILQQCRLTARVSPTSLPRSSVTLRGLKGTGTLYTGSGKAKTLAVFLRDCMLDLPSLRYRLQQVYSQHGLITGQKCVIPSVFPPPSINIMDTRYILSKSVDVNPTLEKQPTFDARDLVVKYRDHVWDQNIPLERLRISRNELQDITRRGTVIGQGYREIASIPLPGVSDLEPEEPGFEHYKAAKTFRENKPVTESWISLRPQSEEPKWLPNSRLPEEPFQVEGLNLEEENATRLMEYRTWRKSLKPAEDGRFYCNECAKSFKYNSGLVQHRQQAYHVKNQKQPPSTG